MIRLFSQIKKVKLSQSQTFGFTDAITRFLRASIAFCLAAFICSSPTICLILGIPELVSFGLSTP
jgi:hypothetical protein